MTVPTLTLLHGFMGDPSDWDLFREEFAECDITTPLIQPASSWSAGIDHLLDQLPARSIFVGYSMGARLLLACALARPEICQGLVFVSGNPGLEDDPMRVRRRQHDHEIAARIDTQSRSEFLTWWYTESTVFRSLTESVRHDEIERKLARSADDWGAILRTYSVADQPNFWTRLQDLQVPTLAVAGKLDRKYTQIAIRMGHHPQIEARIVAACGHIVHREQPYVFFNLLRSYLNFHFTNPERN